MYFSAKNEGITCLDGNDFRMSDDEIMQALSGHVLLSAESAKELIKRGFGKYIGVDVRDWKGKATNAEKVYIDGKWSLVTAQKKMKELVISDSKVIINSMVYNTVDNENYEELFPGCTIFPNELGGRVVTFSGSPDVPYDIMNAFGFLNYTRKKQFISLFSQTEDFPAYCTGDEELYFKCARLCDGRLLCAVFNFGFDPIDVIEMMFEKTPRKITKLTPDGKESEISFEKSDDGYIIDSCCNTLEPVILFVED